MRDQVLNLWNIKVERLLLRIIETVNVFLNIGLLGARYRSDVPMRSWGIAGPVRWVRRGLLEPSSPNRVSTIRGRRVRSYKLYVRRWVASPVLDRLYSQPNPVECVSDRKKEIVKISVKVPTSADTKLIHWLDTGSSHNKCPKFIQPRKPVIEMTFFLPLKVHQVCISHVFPPTSLIKPSFINFLPIIFCSCSPQGSSTRQRQFS